MGKKDRKMSLKSVKGMYSLHIIHTAKCESFSTLLALKVPNSTTKRNYLIWSYNLNGKGYKQDSITVHFECAGSFQFYLSVISNCQS